MDGPDGAVHYAKRLTVLPEPPFSLSSTEWANDYNQVKAFGAANSNVRTAQQTELALFWTENTAVQYARALRNLPGARGLDVADTARLFAPVWTTAADALIGCWNAKYQYNFWRPVTAIRNGDIDGNPGTAAGPDEGRLAATLPASPGRAGCPAHWHAAIFLRGKPSRCSQRQTVGALTRSRRPSSASVSSECASTRAVKRCGFTRDPGPCRCRAAVVLPVSRQRRITFCSQLRLTPHQSANSC